MKRTTLAVLMIALALVALAAPAAFAQAPAPKVTINGLIDNVGTYTRNMSAFDFNLGRNGDAQFYGRTRGRFDFIGEVGKAKGVLGIELDHYWGQTGSQDTNNQNCVTSAASANVACATQGSGAEASFDLNTDTQGNLQIKWLYVEFPLPLIPVPTVARLGGQPFGAAANYKLATYANGDFGGVNIVSTITPNVKVLFTYVAVEEALTGKKDILPIGATGVATTNGIQARGDDLAFIISAEITPFKGLDLKPMYSYFYANGVTSANARQGRGGIVITNGGPFAPGAGLPGSGLAGAANGDGVGTGIGENRHTVGLDARLRTGPFSLDPTVLYQFGHRDGVNTGGTLAYLGAVNTKQRADISAWLVDVRGGFQLGPLLLQAMGMWTSGNRAQDNLFHNVNYFQALDTDTSYQADWGTQIFSLGVDYYQILNGGAAQAGLNPGVAIGYDRYGRKGVGFKATYAVTPELSFGAGVTAFWTDRKVDTDGFLVANGGIQPSVVNRISLASSRPKGDEDFLGTEANLAMTWRFADGLALDIAGGYLFAGKALGHRLVGSTATTGTDYSAANPANRKDRQVNDVMIGTARVRYTF
jgi:hypothetical protein